MRTPGGLAAVEQPTLDYAEDMHVIWLRRGVTAGRDPLHLRERGSSLATETAGKSAKTKSISRERRVRTMR
jgi:hypothetical protein